MRCDSCGSPMFRRSLHWSEGWARLMEHIHRWGQHDPDAPPLDVEIVEVVRCCGGLGVFRRAEVSKWEFKRVWEELK